MLEDQRQNLSADSENEHFNKLFQRKDKAQGKQTNTIMQQINNFSLSPMNDLIAEHTIEDHKYLLENVENKAPSRTSPSATGTSPSTTR